MKRYSEQTYAEKSRQGWCRGDGQFPSVEQLTLGCLQRIADATESMAKSHDEMEEKLRLARNSRDYWRKRAERAERSNQALRGVVTRVRRNADKANA
ncbi:MAG: hypothetical protein AAGB48_08330 [Planctomycetota bacterium]